MASVDRDQAASIFASMFSREGREKRAADRKAAEDAYRAQLRAGYEAKANAPRLAEEAAASATAAADLVSMQKGANEEAARKAATQTLLTGASEDANADLLSKPRGTKQTKRKTLVGAY